MSRLSRARASSLSPPPMERSRALGTEFTLEMVNGTADSGERVELLSVEVTEGKVEVSNAKGQQYLEAAQDGIVAKDTAPYDFNQDEALPDPAQRAHPGHGGRFRGQRHCRLGRQLQHQIPLQARKGANRVRPAPVRRFAGKTLSDWAETLKNIESSEQLAEVFASSVNITEPIKIYVRLVELSSDGNHARAQCIQRKSPRSMTINESAMGITSTTTGGRSTTRFTGACWRTTGSTRPRHGSRRRYMTKNGATLRTVTAAELAHYSAAAGLNSGLFLRRCKYDSHITLSVAVT